MFEFLFKYPATVFSKGKLVWLGGWPLWLLAIAFLAAAAGLWWNLSRNHPAMSRPRQIAIWALQTAMAALALTLLWHPAISIASLKPQQNVISVLVDDSRSMSQSEETNHSGYVHILLLN